MGRWGPSLLIFILVRKYWQNNYKRRYHTGQASVFHELFVKDDLSQPLLLHRLGELHKGPRWMTRSERRRLQKWRDDGGRALLETISNWRRRWTRRLEEDFAKALKRQRLLWCNPSLWSLKLVSPHPPIPSIGWKKVFWNPMYKLLKISRNILEFPYKCFQMPATSLMWLWFGQITRMEEQIKSKLAGKEGHLKWFSCWCGNVDKTTIKEGFSPAKPQSFIDY